MLYGEMYLSGTFAEEMKADATTAKIKFVDDLTKLPREPQSETNIILAESGTPQADLIYFSGHSTTDGITTLTGCVRLEHFGTPLDTPREVNFVHAAGRSVKSVPTPHAQNWFSKIFGGLLKTGAAFFNIGSGAEDEAAGIKANGVKFLRHDPVTGKAQFSNNGTDWVNNDNAGVGTLERGDGIGGTGDEVFVDLATDAGLEFLAGKLLAKIKENGGLVRDADGLSVDQAELDLAFLGTKNFTDLDDTPATFSEKLLSIVSVNQDADGVIFNPITISAGENSVAAANTTQSTDELSFAKLKEIVCPYDGTYTIEFDLNCDTTTSNDYVDARIYKSDTGFGTIRTKQGVAGNADSWESFSENLSFEKGDLIQLWAYVQTNYSGNASARVRNFRVKCSTSFSPPTPIGVVNTD
jgi:hypothetical protein